MARKAQVRDTRAREVRDARGARRALARTAWRAYSHADACDVPRALEAPGGRRAVLDRRRGDQGDVLHELAGRVPALRHRGARVPRPDARRATLADEARAPRRRDVRL